ncbi:L,D-transpeptidase [Streptomyces sp. NPDC087908]|uniref:L,D-transpeptidase n=1 Tax=unclassified Streptomyces TaxID=2593676 RepID=UPI0021C6EAEA|nr:L,D-transpeptidase [Streptomyces sp. adm13(2018)]
MARSSSGFVAGLTAAAVAAVCFLAYQASANAPADVSAAPRTPGTSAPSVSPSGGPKQPAKNPLAVPAASGTGERVVYSLGERRVWIVAADGKAGRTFPVMASTVDPAPGSYSVTSRSGSVRGSDGVQIEHVVRFTTAQDVAIGFSAAVDGSTPSPDPARKTGGIRMKRADGDALWTFAVIGAKVVVVP